jgi:hypothetical protein
MKNAAIGLIVLGLVSLGVSAFWPKISPKPQAMDEQQQEQFLNAVGDAHGARPDEVSEETKKVIEERKQAVEGANRTERLGTTVFKYVGILSALIGAGLFFWAAQTED